MKESYHSIRLPFLAYSQHAVEKKLKANLVVYKLGISTKFTFEILVLPKHKEKAIKVIWPT
jgi:hypothetical protein